MSEAQEQPKRKRGYRPAKALDIKRDKGAPPVIPEQRKEIVEAAKAEILYGQSTLSQIAAKFGISRRTLQYWLAQLGDDYKALREAWIDNLLVDAGEEMESADDQMRLARARELWKRATWYAERRDPSRYGQKQQELAVGIQVVVQRFADPHISHIDAEKSE